ncbi:MAG: hypothetical protein K6C35_03570 [Eubacterium sp.]|nr:hypothetical protein [Eubacterium sp.]
MFKFLGRGSGFSDEHNGACFGLGNKLILLDCPMVSFRRLKNESPEYFAEATDEKFRELREHDKLSGEADGSRRIEELIIAITHTHSDHIAGLALTIHFARFIWKIKVKVIAPSAEVLKNLDYMLKEMDGCSRETYSIVTADEYIAGSGDEGRWLKAAISTVHVPELSGKCFGYQLEVDGRNVIYTGDTCTLDTFMDKITPESILYTECSAYDTGVHLYINKLLEYKNFFEENNVKVYLMHLDDVKKIEEEAGKAGFELAPLA